MSDAAPGRVRHGPGSSDSDHPALHPTTMESARSQPSRRQAWLAAAAVAALAASLHAGTLGHGFALDDGPEVVDNAFVRSTGGLARIFTTASWAGAGDAQVPMYRPLTTLTYAANHAAHGLSPFGYHLVNVLLDAVVCALVVLLALHAGASLPSAAAAGLLFAALPVHVEAVANVAGRKDLLVALFAIGAVLLHSRALRRGGAAVLAAPVLVALALLSKESGLMVVALVATHDLLYEREAWRAHRARGVALLATYAALTAAFVLARHAVLDTLVFPRVPFDENPVAAAPAAVRVMTAVKVLGLGLRLLVVPFPLSADYSYAAILPVESPLDPAFLAASAAVVTLAGLAFAYRRRFPIGAFGALWYAIAIFPASNLLVPIGTIFGERLLYLPSVGVALVVAGLLTAAARSGKGIAAGVGVGLVICALAVRSWDYARAWRDDLALFTAAAAAQPDSAKAQRMLGGALMEAGRPAEALEAFQRAIAIVGKPGTPQDRMAPALVELGVALERLGKLDDADRLYARVLAADPGNADAVWRSGVVQWQRGDREGAIRSWEHAVSLDPGHARALNDLGVAAYLAGDLSRAEALWVRATTLLPTLTSAWFRLGSLHERTGDIPRARAAWQKVLDNAPDRSPELRDEAARKLGATGAARP